MDFVPNLKESNYSDMRKKSENKNYLRHRKQNKHQRCLCFQTFEEKNKYMYGIWYIFKEVSNISEYIYGVKYKK